MADAWRALSARIEAEGGLVLLLGASDSGKTTLARWLLDELAAAGRQVAFLDGDIGQSSLGPPATVGLALVSAGLTPPSLDLIALRFVGAVSPAKEILPLVVGLKRLADKAYGLGAEILVVDTTGLVVGSTGRRLKSHKIDLLAPTHLIALQREDELEPILCLFEGKKQIAISRLPISPAVIPRTPQARREYRAQRFSDYLRGSSLLEFTLFDVAVQGRWMQGGRLLEGAELQVLSKELQTPVLGGECGQDEAFLLTQGVALPEGLAVVKRHLGVSLLRIVEFEASRGLLLGLADEENELVALGLLEELDLAAGRVVCLTPCGERARVRTIHFGSIRLDPSGEDLCEVSIPEVTS